MSGEVDGGHIGICRMQAVGGLLCQVGIRVEVGHAHEVVAVVSRSTIDAVGLGGLRQATVALHDCRRHLLMRLYGVAVGQLLTEEEVVIGPDGTVVVGRRFYLRIRINSSHSIVAHIFRSRYGSAGVDEVAIIGIAFFDIADITVLGIVRNRGIVSCDRFLRYGSISIQCLILV